MYSYVLLVWDRLERVDEFILLARATCRYDLLLKACFTPITPAFRLSVMLLCSDEDERNYLGARS